METNQQAKRNLPVSLRVLLEPSATFREVASSGRGYGALFGLLAIEMLIGDPLLVTSHLIRLGSTPIAAVGGLWTTFLHEFALGPGVAVMALAVLLYYAARFRAPRRLDIWAAASLLAYAWVPHTLMVAAGVVTAGIGADHALLAQHAFEGSPLGTGMLILKAIIAFAPSALLAGIAVRATWSPEINEERSSKERSAGTELRRRATLIVTGALLLAATGFAGHRASRDWRQVRPLLSGDTLPSFALAELNGNSLRSSDLKGRVVLLDFWATWCPPCVAAMPHLERLHRSHADRGFSLVSVSTEPHDLGTVRQFVEERELSFPIYVDDGRLQRRFRVQNLPTAFLVDPQGIVRNVYIGVTSESRMRKDIEALLEERVP